MRFHGYRAKAVSATMLSHISNSRDVYLTKNHYEPSSPEMVPISKIWGPGSWPNTSGRFGRLRFLNFNAF